MHTSTLCSFRSLFLITFGGNRSRPSKLENSTANHAIDRAGAEFTTERKVLKVGERGFFVELRGRRGRIFGAEGGGERFGGRSVRGGRCESTHHE